MIDIFTVVIVYKNILGDNIINVFPPKSLLETAKSWVNKTLNTEIDNYCCVVKHNTTIYSNIVKIGDVDFFITIYQEPLDSNEHINTLEIANEHRQIKES